MTPFYRAIRDLAHLGYHVYGRVRIVGHENIPPSGPVIVAANHVSYLDPPLVGSSIRRECAFMARHDLWKSRFLGWLIAHLNAFPVHRDTADRAAIRSALDALASGKVLVLFPEGTRSDDGRLQAAAPGVGMIVARSGATVIPTAVIGPEQMLPPGASRLRRVPLTVVFGQPLQLAPGIDRREVVARLMRAIAELLTANGRPSSAREGDPVGAPTTRGPRPAGQ
ncbi:MAG: 1-acyl-sn-glycerol-3-phosphate acyltransferase [Chthonomonadales bacterium]|nr:1-acyl-sn-glycerol-3-phosphate acyltransferase [Chthonomonadales bacterium]